MQRPKPTGRERPFEAEDIIVSKTDTKGRITYVNDVFCSVGEYSEDDLLGKPHSIIRHPDMPRAIFALLWQRLKAGEEIFAFVKNLAKSGDHYWVFAHVTPSFDRQGAISGFHSNRRSVPRAALTVIEGLYRDMLAAEQAEADPARGIEASMQLLERYVGERGCVYDAFVQSIAA